MRKKQNKKVLILAGGLGTRLRPLTFAVPKPLIPVRGKPIIDYLICRLLHFGFEDIYISLNYKADLIKLYLADKVRSGIKIVFFDEKIPLGTAGPLALFKRDGIKIAENESIMVINGDILTDLNFNHFLLNHEESGADLTVAMTVYSHKLSYGVLNIDQDKNIRDVNEKPNLNYKVSAGIYLLKQRCMRLVPEKLFIMPELIKASLEKGFRVKGYLIQDHWLAIEQIKNLEEVHKERKNDWISKLLQFHH